MSNSLSTAQRIQRNLQFLNASRKRRLRLMAELTGGNTSEYSTYSVYLRPDGTSRYLRPDGSTYQRP